MIVIEIDFAQSKEHTFNKLQFELKLVKRILNDGMTENGWFLSDVFPGCEAE